MPTKLSAHSGGLCWPRLANCDGWLVQAEARVQALWERLFQVSLLKGVLCNSDQGQMGWCLSDARSLEGGRWVSWKPRRGGLDKLLKNSIHHAYGGFSVKQCQFHAGFKIENVASSHEEGIIFPPATQLQQQIIYHKQ